MEKYEEFITWSTYSGMLAGGLHSVIQDWRVLKIVKKIKKILKVQWILYACVIGIHVHGCGVTRSENLKDPGVWKCGCGLHIYTFIHVEC